MMKWGHRNTDYSYMTKREAELHKLLCLNYTYHEIADMMGIKFTTVKTHSVNLFHKLCVNSRVELMAQEIAKLRGEEVNED